jgi:sulfatase maturation enzyme AslB (radical SAM superfamily)
MNPRLLIKSVRKLRNAVALNVNFVRGRQFIPKARGSLGIETSSYCNLNCCFCAYGKKQSAKVTMSDAFFQDCVGQAVDLGYRTFELTPCTGDVFMDHHIFNKLQFLDDHPGVENFGFHTNLTIPKSKDIERFVRLNKLHYVVISIYGCDLETFVAITKSTEKVYRRLIANLEAMLAVMDRRKFGLNLSFHTGRKSLRGVNSDITRLVGQYQKAGINVRSPYLMYNNWGGYVTQEDVKGLPFHIHGPGAVYKKGACVRLFTSVQIMATGIVNGCSCRDVDATLRLGDLHKQPLRDIISSRNQAYMKLIDEQQRGEFRKVCENCDFYASIYRNSSTYRKHGVALQSLEEFKANLG